MLGAVIMDCRGLVDPRNKPFGNVLPLEIQIKIMFWVHCFYTMDKRKKLVQEFKELPKCNITGFPQRLGEYHWWNQVVFRLHAPRGSHCHHCNRIMGHRLSVREKKCCCYEWVEKMTESLCFLFLFADWHDGGNGAAVPELGQPDERGHCVCHRPVQTSDPELSRGSTPRDDWSEESCLRYSG